VLGFGSKEGCFIRRDICRAEFERTSAQYPAGSALIIYIPETPWPRPLPLPHPCTPSNLMVNHAMKIMNRHSENTTRVFARIADGLVWKQRPGKRRPPAPQTSPSMYFRSSCQPVRSNLTYPIPRSQFSDSQTSSSYPFSPISLQTRISLDPMHGSVSSIV